MTPTPQDATRTAAFDGLRGLGCLLVVAGHLWLVVPTQTLSHSGPFQGYFKSGSLGVAVFMTLGGYLVTRSIERHLTDRPIAGAASFAWRRSVRIGAQLLPLLAAVAVVSRFERWDDFTPETTRNSLVAIATFRYNTLLVRDPAGTRGDLGHLWYLSVEQQFYLGWLVVMVLLRRRRLLVASGLALATIAVWRHRAVVFDDEGWWSASLLTTTRIDSLALGALVAIVLSPGRVPNGLDIAAGLRRHGRAAWLGSLAALLVLVGLSHRFSIAGTTIGFDSFGYLHTQGAAVAVVTALLVAAIATRRDDALLRATLGCAPLRWIGQVSFPLYLWHLPAFWAANRWGANKAWLPRFLIVATIVVTICVIVDRLIERPTARWLRGVGAGGRAA